MSSRILFILALIVTVVIGFANIGCHIIPKRSIAAILAEITEHAPDKTDVELQAITDFEWTGFVAFGPYTTKEEAERTLGFAWPEYSAFGLDSSDSFTLIAFVNGKKIVRVEQVNRCHPDFGKECLSRILDPTHAIFILKKERCNVLHLRSLG